MMMILLTAISMHATLHGSKWVLCCIDIVLLQSHPLVVSH